jgi:hypothetical protein
MMRQVSSNYLTTERVVWTFYWQELADCIVFIDVTSADYLVAKLVGARD